MKSADRQTAEEILFADQYQLTMAQLYFREGIRDQPAQFDHFFRKYPDYGVHQAGSLCIAGPGPGPWGRVGAAYFYGGYFLPR